MIQNIKYFFKRKYRQIERVFDYLPIIWKGYDFDYSYSVDLFKKSLERQAKLFESEAQNSDRSKQNASRIRTAIQLMDKVYSGDYEMEWIDILQQKYGKDVLDWNFEDMSEDGNSSYLKYEYEKWDNAGEIQEMKKVFLKISQAKQKRAHKLLWDFIEHNIQYWWD